MTRIQKALLAITLVIFGSNCREPFEPDFETGVNDYLVVEGYINVGNKAVTIIKLSRVSPLDDAETPAMESDAVVTIEDRNNNHYNLQETTEGTYESDSLSLDQTQEYRIQISRSNGLTYSSAFVQPTITPAIDSIHWESETTGIHIYVNAHDNENQTKFYSWTYRETWQITSDYMSKFKYEDGVMVRRSTDEAADMWNCWKDDYPDDLKFGSTEQLSADVIHYDLVSFGHGAERIRVRYSILVSQRALGEAEYRYLQLVQKNSTNTGSLFDPMPSGITGNISCTTSPEVQAIGYVGASTTETLRKFILPDEVNAPEQGLCKRRDVTSDSLVYYFGSLGYIPVDSLGLDDDLNLLVYSGAPILCMDCRLHGYSDKPDFW
jgi:hypothetical protein